VAGQQYDPLRENSKGYPYNGDLWSSTAPAGNTCPNYGTPTGAESKEGYTLYNCQWPAPSIPRAGQQPILRHEHHRHAHAHELR
jgi:hypothetical protein